MAADALVTCVTRASATMVLIMYKMNISDTLCLHMSLFAMRKNCMDLHLLSEMKTVFPGVEISITKVRKSLIFIMEIPKP